MILLLSHLFLAVFFKKMVVGNQRVQLRAEKYDIHAEIKPKNQEYNGGKASVYA